MLAFDLCTSLVEATFHSCKSSQLQKILPHLRIPRVTFKIIYVLPLTCGTFHHYVVLLHHNVSFLKYLSNDAKRAK